MSLLLNSLIVSDPSSSFYNSKVNLLIGSNGIIEKISKKKINKKGIRSIDFSSKKISNGWFDFSANFCDPGFEFKEDLVSGVKLAYRSGFVDVLLKPNTNPIIQNKNDISYIIKKSQNKFCKIHPCAAVTKDFNGKNLNDIIDIFNAGAIAFTDYNESNNAELILNTLLYLKQFNGLYLSKPKYYPISRGNVNESLNSEKVGLKGIPYISETIAIKRDLSILEYTGGKIHFSGISTKESVDLIRQAKKKGLNVTCDVPVYNLILDDSNILNFDTNYKVDPPLRSNEDINELLSGIDDGTIDVITSNHEPQDFDSKNCEFDKASFGIISIQTFYSNILELSRKIPFEKLLPTFTSNPRKILGLENNKIEEGSFASLTIFDAEGSWDYNEETNISKSLNSPWLNWSLKGKVKGVVVGKNFNFDE